MKLLESEIRDVISGNSVTIIRPANIYECELKDNVFIGPFVEILDWPLYFHTPFIT
jgi:hypothetical protein